MTVKYVVSIGGELLYFDESRQSAQPLSSDNGAAGEKPELQLLPPGQQPAAGSEWDKALAGYSADQRESAEISEVL